MFLLFSMAPDITENENKVYWKGVVNGKGWSFYGDTLIQRNSIDEPTGETRYRLNSAFKLFGLFEIILPPKL